MPDARPPIPAALRREVLVEAGHRCAIPTCRQHPVEIDHIVEWTKVRSHEFDNLIALCPTCHARKTRGEIDVLSMKQYKVNLGVLASRYSDLELKLLRFLFDYAPGRGTPMISDGMTWVISDLLSDGMVQLRDDRWILPSGRPDGPNPLQLHRDLPQGRPARFVSLTEKGIDLVERWFGGKPVDIVAWEEFEARIASDPDHPMHRISKPVENTHASADTEQSAEPCATGFDTKRSDEPEPEVD